MENKTALAVSQEQRNLAGKFMAPAMARVIGSVSLTEAEKLIEIAPPRHIPLGHQPGQFVEASILGVGEAPISIASSTLSNGNFQLCVRRAGNLTGALQDLPPGSSVGIRGPFGRGFPVNAMLKQDVLIVAGGLGLAPLRSLIQNLFERREDFGKVTLLIGSKRPQEILFKSELEEWKSQPDCDLRISVDHASEGWEGKVGVITVLFKDLQLKPKKTVAVVVGPPVMYKFVILELLSQNIPEEQIYVSLERRMKCGIGKCGHCQMDGFYVCKEGPVFSYAELKDCREAFGWKRKP